MIKTRLSNIKNKPYEVAEDTLVTLSNGHIAFIHEYYATDYASIPSILKLFLEWKGNEGDAYIIHDYLYHYRSYKSPSFGFIEHKALLHKPVTRKWADKEMRIWMKKGGSPKWRSTLYYVAVRLFGRKSWGNM